MEFIRGIHNIRPHHAGSVVTIGNFDGVHLGHTAVISGAINKARELGVPSTVMIFEPQPMELFLQDGAPARLYRLRDKYMQLRRLGVDRLLCIKFNREFSNMSAMDFIERLLVEKLAISHLIVGDDFCFGKGRKGNFEMLQQAGQRFGFQVNSTQSFRLADCRISSTAIRSAIMSGDFSSARQMLGHSFSINGTVKHGDKKGRTIGFPTANVPLLMTRCPCSGVYAVTVDTPHGVFGGVANIGYKPTVSGQQRLLEVHVFDSNMNLYGQRISVAPVSKIRDEQKFASFEALKQQIILDAQHAKSILNNVLT